MSEPRIVVKLGGLDVLDLSPLQLLCLYTELRPLPGLPIELEVRGLSNSGHGPRQWWDAGIVPHPLDDPDEAAPGRPTDAAS